MLEGASYEWSSLPSIVIDHFEKYICTYSHMPKIVLTSEGDSQSAGSTPRELLSLQNALSVQGEIL